MESGGDGPAQSWIRFTILGPKTPPEVSVGVDITVNEGDPVSLGGFIADIDDIGMIDDYQYLWHLVSSTNGQSLPDASGTTKSLNVPHYNFVPYDNGSYIFSLTAIDNTGLRGSDTIVVTVDNAKPLVSFPRITRRTFLLGGSQTIAFTAAFTDAGIADTHTAVWTWGDGSGVFEGAVTEIEMSGSGSVNNPHTYAPGIYTLQLIVEDDDGGSVSIRRGVHVGDVGSSVKFLNSNIQSLPDSAFVKDADQSKKAFNNKFAAIQNQLAAKAYQGIIDSVRNSLLTKFDGKLGGDPTDDWIIQDQAIQQDLLEMVNDVIGQVGNLQTPSIPGK